MKSEIIEEAYNAYYNNFSGKPEIIAYAPGRVNLIGEHTDYNDGFVCPFAIELHTIVVGRRISGNVINHKNLGLLCCYNSTRNASSKRKFLWR